MAQTDRDSPWRKPVRLALLVAALSSPVGGLCAAAHRQCRLQRRGRHHRGGPRLGGGGRRGRAGQCRRFQRAGAADCRGRGRGRVRERRSRADAGGRTIRPPGVRLHPRSARRTRSSSSCPPGSRRTRSASRGPCRARHRTDRARQPRQRAGRSVRAAMARARRPVGRRVATKVVPTLSVRAALAAVRAGRVDAGVVFATDARTMPDVTVAYAVPAADAPADPVSGCRGARAPRSRGGALRRVPVLARGARDLQPRGLHAGRRAVASRGADDARPRGLHDPHGRLRPRSWRCPSASPRHGSWPDARFPGKVVVETAAHACRSSSRRWPPGSCCSSCSGSTASWAARSTPSACRSCSRGRPSWWRWP